MSAITLNPQQDAALVELSNAEGYYTLKGYAGTGKTTLITHWIKQVRQRPSDLPDNEIWHAPKIVLTAPTNKATNVLKDKAKELNLPVDCSTIHSLLSLKMKWQKDKQVLVEDDRGDYEFDNYDYVIIDECSMIGSEGDSPLFQFIHRAKERAGNTVIFMGDPCQLPPINEKDSRTFNCPDQSELTMVMRQGKGNPIVDLSIYLRELIEQDWKWYPNRLFEFIDDKHILLKKLATHQEEIMEAFVNPEDKDIRHVAWTNATVDTWNDHIRDRLYGFDREEWVKGELIVTTAPVVEPYEEDIIFTTDTLMELTHEPQEETLFDVPVWKLRAKGKPFWVVRKEGRTAFQQKKEELLKNARENRKWRDFYVFIQHFSSIKPAHSLTVHRSQGSTFDDVYVSFENILKNPNKKESLQCLYVAITRPRRRLILV